MGAVQLNFLRLSSSDAVQMISLSRPPAPKVKIKQLVERGEMRMVGYNRDVLRGTTREVSCEVSGGSVLIIL